MIRDGDHPNEHAEQRDIPIEAPDAVKEMEAMRSAGAERHRKMVADSEMTLSFLSGNQWVEYTWQRGIQEVSNENNEVRETENYMLNAYRRWNHYMFSSDPVMIAFEGGKELQDAEMAAVATSLCDFWEKKNGWRNAREDQIAWSAIAGIGYVAPVWRKNYSKPKSRTKLEYSEKPIVANGKKSFIKKVSVTDYHSDIAFEFLNPLQTYLYPLDANRWSKVEEILYVDVVTMGWIKNNIENTSKIDFDNLAPIKRETVNIEALERINRHVSAEFGLAARPDFMGDRYLLMHRWRKPSKSEPRGRYTVTVGNQVAIDGGLPYLKEARNIDPGDSMNITMGVIPCTPINFPGRLFPPSIFGQMRSRQIRLNELITDQRANRKAVGRNKLLIQQDSLVHKDAWTDEHGEIIELQGDRAGFPPQYLQGQPLVGLDQEIQRAIASLEEASGQTAVLRGHNMPNVRAAFHLDIIREEAMQLIYSDIRNLEKSHELQARLSLEIARHRYDDERLIAIVGRDRAGMALQYKSGDLNLDIRVRPGSMKPRNFAVIEAKLTELLQYGAFSKENKEGMKIYWRMSELGTLNPSFDEDERHRVRAEEESVRMLVYKEIIAPQEGEDHFIHEKQHRADFARPEWYNADDSVRAVMLAHIEETLAMARDLMAPETNMPGEPVAGLPGGMLGIPGAENAGPGGQGGTVPPMQ